MRLLVVADDPDRLRRFSAWVPDQWAVGTARDGRAALRAVDEDVDVVVTCLELPDRSGESLIRAIHNYGYECQIVALSEAEEAVPLADDTVTAPVGREEFESALRRAGDRVAYDERLREYYSLVSKRATMEARNSPAELAESEEYDRVTERARQLRGRVDELLEEASGDGFDRVFRGFFPGRPGVEGAG